MALKKESLAKLLVRLGMAADETAATTMITEEKENDVVLPEGDTAPKIFTPAELITRDKAKYEQAKKAVTGMTIDGIFEKELPEYKGKKDAETLVAELTKKVAAEGNKDVDTKVKERDTTISTLRANIVKMEQDKTLHESQMEKKQRQTDILLWTAHMKPDNLTPEQWIAVLESENELVKDDSGGIFVKRNGQFVQDTKLATNIPAKDALTAYITERKLGKVEDKGNGGGGRGAGDSKTGGTGGIRTKSAFEAYCTDNKIPLNGEKARAELDRITKEVTDFDFQA